MTEVESIRMELLEMEIERLRKERALVGGLVPHWRACALTADTDAERDVWLLAADQLEYVQLASGVDPPGGGVGAGVTPPPGGHGAPGRGRA